MEGRVTLYGTPYIFIHRAFIYGLNMSIGLIKGKVTNGSFHQLCDHNDTPSLSGKTRKNISVNIGPSICDMCDRRMTEPSPPTMAQLELRRLGWNKPWKGPLADSDQSDSSPSKKWKMIVFRPLYLRSAVLRLCMSPLKSLTGPLSPGGSLLGSEMGPPIYYTGLGSPEACKMFIVIGC